MTIKLNNKTQEKKPNQGGIEKGLFALNTNPFITHDLKSYTTKQNNCSVLWYNPFAGK
jgi:hypothetical protein